MNHLAESAMESQNQRNNTCSICLDEIFNFLEKTYFSCGHFVCKPCYNTFREYQLGKMQKDVFCPECRQVQERCVMLRRPRLFFMGNIVAIDDGSHMDYEVARQTPLSLSNDNDESRSISTMTNTCFTHKCVVSMFYSLMVTSLVLVVFIITWSIVQCSTTENVSFCNRKLGGS